VAIRHPYLRVVGFSIDSQGIGRSLSSFKCANSAHLIQQVWSTVADVVVLFLFLYLFALQARRRDTVQTDGQASAILRDGVEERGSGHLRYVPHSSCALALHVAATTTLSPELFWLFPFGVCMANVCAGHHDIKKAIACLLFCGSRKSLPDGMRLRGDINVLLLVRLSCALLPPPPQRHKQR
jgi:hypothetical protein